MSPRDLGVAEVWGLVQIRFGVKNSPVSPNLREINRRFASALCARSLQSELLQVEHDGKRRRGGAVAHLRTLHTERCAEKLAAELINHWWQLMVLYQNRQMFIVSVANSLNCVPPAPDGAC